MTYGGAPARSGPTSTDVTVTPAEMVEPVIGIIGGSGLYDIARAGRDLEWRRKSPTPWGEPSDALLFGRLGGYPVSCSCLGTGAGTALSPTHLNYRANIDALKRAGLYRGGSRSPRSAA